MSSLWIPAKLAMVIPILFSCLYDTNGKKLIRTQPAKALNEVVNNTWMETTLEAYTNT